MTTHPLRGNSDLSSGLGALALNVAGNAGGGGASGASSGPWLADDGALSWPAGLLGGDASGHDSLAAQSYLIGQSQSFGVGGGASSSSDDNGSSPPGNVIQGNAGPPSAGLSGLDLFNASHAGNGHGHGGGGGPPPPPASSNLTFVVNWDASVAGAPSGFMTGFQSAVNYFLNNFTASSPITITLDVGWGEAAGTPLPIGVLGENIPTLTSTSYSALYTAMSPWATGGSPDQQAAFASLPGSDPLSATQYVVTTADAKVLGLPTNASVDDSMGFASSLFPYKWNFTSSAKGNQFDFVGVAEHEISEALGRVSGLDLSSGTSSNLDLFRYSGPGARYQGPGGTAYLSFDNGATNLSNFNTGSSGDQADWAGTTLSNDAYNYALGTGGLQVSTADTRELNVLGYTLQPGVVV